jgi:hypothetical protein
MSSGSPPGSMKESSIAEGGKPREDAIAVGISLHYGPAGFHRQVAPGAMPEQAVMDRALAGLDLDICQFEAQRLGARQVTKTVSQPLRSNLAAGTPDRQSRSFQERETRCARSHELPTPSAETSGSPLTLRVDPSSILSSGFDLSPIPGRPPARSSPCLGSLQEGHSPYSLIPTTEADLGDASAHPRKSITATVGWSDGRSWLRITRRFPLWWRLRGWSSTFRTAFLTTEETHA